MKLKITILAVVTLMATTFTYGQTTQFRYRVLIQKKHKIIQDVKTEKADTLNLPAGTIISSQKKYKIGDTEYTADIRDTIKTSTQILGTKDIPVNKTLSGWATVAVDKEDKSKLNINYWRNPVNTFPIGTQLLIKTNNKTETLVLKSEQSYEVSFIKLTYYRNYEFNKKLKVVLEDSLKELIKKIITYPEIIELK
jgi:hypothetical protein